MVTIMKVFLNLILVLSLKSAPSKEQSSTEPSIKGKVQKSLAETEDFATWRRVQMISYSSQQEEANAADNYVLTRRRVQAFNMRTNETYIQDVQSYADQDPNNLLKNKAGMKFPEGFFTTTEMQTTSKPKRVGFVTSSLATTKKSVAMAIELPEKVNYAAELIEVKDQLNCASCYV